jgi:hypothetical protein
MAANGFQREQHRTPSGSCLSERTQVDRIAKTRPRAEHQRLFVCGELLLREERATNPMTVT